MRSPMSDDSVMQDAMTETHDLHVSVLHTGASRPRVSPVVLFGYKSIRMYSRPNCLKRGMNHLHEVD
jgi:hypothetical protein